MKKGKRSAISGISVFARAHAKTPKCTTWKTQSLHFHINIWLNLRSNRDASTKGICLMWSRGRRFPPSLLGHLQLAQAICGPKSRGASSWYSAPTKCPGGTAVGCVFSLFFSHYVLNMPCETHSDYILVTG